LIIFYSDQKQIPIKKIIRYQLIGLCLLSVQTSFSQNIKSPGDSGLWTVDISNDDKYIALGGDDSLLRIFTSDLKLLKSEKLEARGMIRAVHWHPKEPLLGISTRNDIWIVNPVTGEETKLDGDHRGSRTIAWNSNGEMLAAAAGSGIIWIWKKNGKLLRKIQKGAADGSPDKKDFLGVDWHPSKNILTTVGDEIRIFDTSGKQLIVFKHRVQQAGLLTVKWHPSGDFFVTGDCGHPDEGKLTLLQFWQTDGKLMKEWNGSKREFRNIRWNKQGTSDALRIWSKNGKLLYTAKPHGNSVLWGTDWISDSKKIVTVRFDSGNIQLWDGKANLLKTIN
jgi:WD40 repeat protein